LTLWIHNSKQREANDAFKEVIVPDEFASQYQASSNLTFQICQDVSGKSAQEFVESMIKPME
jgi:hypothetical protein